MKTSTSLISLVLAAALVPVAAYANPLSQTKAPIEDKFRQLENEDWPTPNEYRNASGAPGKRYWQQKVDYKIDASLDEAKRTITGTATVTYQNNSPDDLPFLWMLLDHNIFKRDSISEMTRTVGENAQVSTGEITRAERMKTWDGGFTNLKITDDKGRPVPFKVVDTLLRVDLNEAVASGASTRFTITWVVPMIETRVIGGRSGYECFTKPDEDGNCLFLGAQWFPRLAVYSDYEGWHNKAFLGSGEFTLEFGDYDVRLTVPGDHVVGATGALMNADQVLSAAQKARFEQAKTAKAPVYIVTPEEAAAAEKAKAPGAAKTWHFAAKNVRDFAFATSRKYIWDAQGVKQDYEAAPLVMAQSLYPKEARPLWDAYSTKSIVHTIDVYADFGLPYPYPTSWSVNGPVGGMEYPMFTFNGPRPVKDKKTGELTYSDRTKYGLIGVIIHEVGHNWYPMIINSDERQWTWMDEGLNTFVQYQAELRWDAKYPVRRGEPKDIIEYMVSKDQVPLMVQSDSLVQFGANGYAKPATALNILRETVMGRELFDDAFREYAKRWRFKRPTPYDFFRTMEEVSGVDLDWFWRGWFYSTDHVDISLDKVVKARVNTGDPAVEKAWQKAQDAKTPGSLSVERNAGIPTVVETDPSTRDFYNETDQYTVTVREADAAKARKAGMEPEEKAAVAFKDNIYDLTLSNVGGLVMPVILKFSYTDGSNETVRIPAEIWRRNSQKVTWRYMTAKTVKEVELDPRLETADADRTNNFFPRRIDERTLNFQSFPQGTNRMQDMNLQVTPDSIKTVPSSKAKK